MKRKLLFITLLMLFCSTMFGQQHWQMTEADIVNYNLTMTVYADVTFNTDPLGDLDETKYEIAAFHNGVLRGVATPTYSEKLKRYTFRLIVHSKEIGQTISFKFFNPKEGPEGTVYNTDYTVNFSNGTVGMSLRPITIDFYEPYFDFDAPSSVENYMGFGCAVKIDGVEQNRPNLEIAAFKENGEVCGYARSQALVGTNIYIYSLQIYAQNGETISFKLFDPTIGEDGDVLSTDYTIKCNVNYDSEAEIVYIDFKNNAVAQIGNNYYTTLEAALAATMDNDVVTIIKSTNETIGVPAGNNVTIKALEGVELSGGAGGSYYNKSVTFDGLTFKGGKGIALTAGVDGITYTVKNCTFDGVQATAWKQGVISLNGNATVVVENNIITDVKNATEGDGRIDSEGQQSTGIYTNNAVEVTISGNTITNVDGTGISSNSNAGEVDIKDNKISAWGTGATAKNEGRAIRTSGGTEVAITGNVMIDNGTAKEEFVKATGMTVSFDASGNYWSGKNPLEEGIFDTDFAKDPAQIIDNYYTDAEKSNLVELAPSVAKIGDTYYATLKAALKAATEGCSIDLLADVEVSEPLNVSSNSAFDKINVTFNGNGKTIKAVGNTWNDNIWLADIAWNVTLNNVTFDGNNTGCKGVQFYTSTSTLNNITVKNVSADKWNSTDYAIHANASELTVTGSLNFEGCKHGMLMVDLGSNTGKVASVVSIADNATVNGVKVILNHKDASMKAPETAAAYVLIGNVEGYTMVYENGSFKLVEAVAKIGDTYYATLEAALNAAQPGETVTILAGDYTTNITINKAITVEGERDDNNNNLVTFNGKLNITANGAIAKNLNVNNGGSTAGYINAKDVLVEGCDVTGGNGFYYCYTAGTVTFKDSKITGATYGIHFDGSAGGNIVIDNCDITGWTSFAGTITNVAITNTEFLNGNYNQLRFYQNAQMTNCKFNEEMTIDFGMNDVNAEFEGCAVVDTEGNATDAPLTDVIYLGDIAEMGVDVTINSEPVIVEAKVADNNGDNASYFLVFLEALNAAQANQTVTVLQDITLEQTATIAEGKTVVLDLNGKTINAGWENESDGKHIYAFTNNGTLTIKDSSTEANGTINARGNFNYGTMTLVNGTINAIDGNGGYGVRNYSGASFTMNAGTIATTLEDDNKVDKGGYDATPVCVDEGATFTMNGGTINNICDFTVAIDNYGTTTIEGGTFTSVHTTVINHGTMTIDGGTFTCNGLEGITAHALLADAGTTTINGGTFNGKDNYNGFNVDASEGATVYITGGNFLPVHSGSLYGKGTIAVSGGTFFDDVTEFCAEGFTAKPNAYGTYDVRFADYIVLPTGMNESNYETLFGTNTVTDGTNYYATLQAAVESVVGTESTLYCKPGSDVGELQHAPVTNTLTVYGNGAFVSGDSERDFDLGNTDPSGGQDITSDMTLTVKYLDGCGAWGTKATEHTVNLVFENCYNMGKAYITGTTGTLNITMTDCAFEGVIAEALYSNADGAITLTNVDFSNLNKAVNLNHKAAGTQTVTMTGCTFTDCGNVVAADQIPVRVLSSVEGGSSVLTVNACTFTGTPEGGADILLDYGVGITTATVSNTVAYVVVEREDNVQTDNDKTTTSAAQTYTFDNRPYVAKVGEVSYKTIAEALAAVQDGGTITLINNVTEEFAINNTTADITLDMAGFTLNGNIQPSEANLTIKNGTINNENASYSAIEINAGTLVLNDVKVTSKRHGVRIDGAVTATIEGGEYRLSATSGTRHAVNVSGAANVTIKAGTFVGPKGTSMDSGSAVCVQSGATVTIEGGDFSGGKTATLGVSGTMIVKGGTFDQDPSEYVAEGYLCGFNQETERYEVTMGVVSVTQNGSTTYYRTLAEAITAVGSGEVVINLHANATLDYNAREAYGTAETTSLTINGNGNTLTLNQKDSDWSSFGLANADAKVVFNNMIIEKTGYGDTSGAWNTHAIIFSSNVEMTNVTVNNSMAVQDGATLNNVTINEANGYYGLWINGNGQSVTMNGGSINATNGGRGIKIADEYVGAPALVTLNVTGTTFNTAKKAAVLVSSTEGAKVKANGCDITDVAEDSINFVWVDEEWAAYYNNVKVYDEATKTQENEESFPIKVWYVNGEGVQSSVRAYYKNLDDLFAAPATQVPGSNYIDLRDNVVANNEVDVNYGSNRVYTFGTSVEGGVTMEFRYDENWNKLPKFDLGQNITMNVPYLQVIGGDISIAGTLNTGYLYLYGTGEGVVIEETGVVNANVSNDKTVQVKGGTVLTVNGKLNTSTLNVWTQDVNNSKLIVSGTDAQVTASHIHAWNGKDGVSSQEIIVESGALLTAEKLQADRGSIVTVDAATLTATTLTLGYEGNIGTLVVRNNGVITNGIVISSVESTVSGPENLTVTSGVNGYGVNYFNGVYSLVEIEIQETELFKGWNWFSAYVDINGEAGLTKIQSALAGNATLMKSHTAFGTYYNEEWINEGGNGLSSASVTEMYMIQMETAMTGENKMQLEGNLVNPSEHTIQLNQNWNWIGYPSNKPINLENAFNGFTPQNGDRIKSHVGFSQYYGEGSNDFGITGWWGTLENMTPGLGYMYYRAGEGTATFTYNVPADGAKSELRANITADDNYWVPATHRYANNMTMVAMLEGANADNYEVAAFVDGEVRGSARPVYVEPLDAYMFFLTIYGDEVEEMSFRCYDLATGEEYAINDRINYSVDAMLGSIEEPYMFRGTVGIGEATLSEINIYPNPTTTGREISFDATCETVEVFNTLGVKVAEYHYVDTIDAFETAGIYMIRITNNGNVQNCRVVVK